MRSHSLQSSSRGRKLKRYLCNFRAIKNFNRSPRMCLTPQIYKLPRKSTQRFQLSRLPGRFRRNYRRRIAVTSLYPTTCTQATLASPRELSPTHLIAPRPLTFLLPRVSDVAAGLGATIIPDFTPGVLSAGEYTSRTVSLFRKLVSALVRTRITKKLLKRHNTQGLTRAIY
jgi:hypothetical protein